MLQDQRRKKLKKRMTPSTNDILARSAGDGMEKEVIQKESTQIETKDIPLKSEILSEKAFGYNLKGLSPSKQAETGSKSIKKQKEIKFIPHEPYKAAVEPYPFMLNSAFNPTIGRHRTRSESKKGKALIEMPQSPKSDVNIKKFPYTTITNVTPNLHDQSINPLASSFGPSFVSLSPRDFFNLKLRDDINLKEDIRDHIDAFNLKLQREPLSISRTLKDDRSRFESFGFKLKKEDCRIDLNQKDENILLNEQNQHLQEESRKLQQEKEELISQLNMQSKVNTELKKLLVASVGDDLQLRFELLTRDKAKLAHDIHCYSEKLCHDFEQLEKLSIQCDVWRSKFLASRVMVDELANWKALLCRKYEESQHALAQLLTEHKDIKVALLHVYRTSRNIKERLTPSNSQGEVLNTCNFLHLTRSIRFLIDSIYVKLFGDRSPTQLTADMCYCEDFTQAEKSAFQILTNQDIDLNEALQIDLAASLSGSRIGLINRFHPETKFEQLTISCCGKCKGDIKVV